MLRSSSSIAVAVAMLFLSVPADAAPMLALATGGVNPSRTGAATRDQAHLPNAISFADCVANVQMTFTLTAAAGTFQTGTDTVQVWAGIGDCTMTPSRSNAQSGTCQPVSDPVGVTTTFSVTVSARDLVYASLGKASPGNGALVSPVTHQTDVSVCSQRTDSAAAPMNVAFLDFNSSTTPDQAATSVVYTAAMGSGLDITVDTVGPPLPTAPVIGVGSGLLKLSWTPVDNANDTAGFTVFCDPAPGKDPALAPGPEDGAAPMCVDSGASTDTGVPVDSAGPVDSAIVDADDAGDADASAMMPPDSSASDSSASPDSSSATNCSTVDAGACFSTVIQTNVNGSLIDPYYVCASITDKTSTQAQINGLANGTKYTFGVSASDRVGNAGPVLAFPCGTPEPIDDFWNQYKNDGGGAGGNFCALDAAGMPVGTAVLGVGFGVAALALVRRRRKR